MAIRAAAPLLCDRRDGPEPAILWDDGELVGNGSHLEQSPVCNTNNQGGGSTAANNSWTSDNVLSALQAGFSRFRFTPRPTNDCVANSLQAGSNQPQLVLWMNQ